MEAGLEQEINTESNLDDSTLAKLLFAVLVKRLGGKVTITQKDIDEVAYSTLNEYRYPDGSPEFVLVERKMAA